MSCSESCIWEQSGKGHGKAIPPCWHFLLGGFPCTQTTSPCDRQGTLLPVSPCEAFLYQHVRSSFIPPHGKENETTLPRSEMH